MKIDSSHYSIPPKTWIMYGGGEARSRHKRSAHTFHKRQAARLARRVGKQIIRESTDVSS